MFICMQKNGLEYLEYFLKAWSSPSKIIVLPCRKIWYPKCWNQLVENFDVYRQAKSLIYHSTSFKDIPKKLANFIVYKVSVFGVILVCIFPAFSRIWTEYGEILRIRSISLHSVRMRKNVLYIAYKKNQHILVWRVW